MRVYVNILDLENKRRKRFSSFVVVVFSLSHEKSLKDEINFTNMVNFLFVCCLFCDSMRKLIVLIRIV